MNKFIICGFLWGITSLQAATYLNFTPRTTLADIKKSYPNATIEPLAPEWLGANETLIKLTDSQLQGDIYISTAKESAADVNETIRIYQRFQREGASQNKQSYQKDIDRYQNYLNLTEDAQHTVKWVRWVPPNPLPLDQLRSQYGPVERFDNKANQGMPSAEWPSKGLFANLTEDQQYAQSVEFYFTDADIQRAFGLQNSSPDKKALLPDASKSKRPTKPKSPQP